MIKKHFLLCIFLIVAVMEMVLGFLLIPGEEIDRELRKERQSMASHLSSGKLQDISDFAYDVEKELIYGSGINLKIRGVFIPDEEQYKNSRFISSMGGDFFNWLSRRFTVAGNILHALLLRAGFLNVWQIPLGLILLAGVITGLLIRSIKIYNFALTSSVRLQLSSTIFKVLLALLWYALWWPLYLPPDFLFILMIFFSLNTVLCCANLQKRM